MPRTRIFDKESVDYALYESALLSAESSTDEKLRAIAINLRCDHRVTDERETKFRKVFNGDIRDSIIKYFKENIKKATIPDYCQSYCDNLIIDNSPSTKYCCDGFDRTTDLVTVFSLNGLREPLKRINSTLRRGQLLNWDNLKDYKITASLENPKDFDSWLDSQLSNADSEYVEKIIITLFEVLNYDLTVNSKLYKPMIWVTDWKVFEKYTNEKKTDGSLFVNRWNQVVGVHRPWSTWQIVIKYPANKVRALYNPCQLDGSDYPQHFPPPREFQFANGGHTMDIAAFSSDLLPEYIHMPIVLEPEYWTELKLIGKTEIQHYALSSSREAHYQKLKQHYDPGNIGVIENWMPKPI